MKFGCSMGIFLNSANLICRSTDSSKCFRGSLWLKDSESRLFIWTYFQHVWIKSVLSFKFGSFTDNIIRFNHWAAVSLGNFLLLLFFLFSLLLLLLYFFSTDTDIKYFVLAKCTCKSFQYLRILKTDQPVLAGRLGCFHQKSMELWKSTVTISLRKWTVIWLVSVCRWHKVPS